MPEFAWIAFWVGTGIWAVLTFLRLKAFLHILQLEEYFTRSYVHWLSTNYDRYLRTMPGAAAGPALAYLLLTMDDIELVGLAVWAIVGAGLAVTRPRHKAKKPLVMTARAKRVLYVSAGLWIAAVALATGIGLAIGEHEAVAAGVFVASVLCAFAGHVVALANLLLAPVEARMRRKFEVAASAKLADQRPKIIAITGSAGKTTTKEMVSHLLSGRFRVLKTPASFNTPMGISRTVNEMLEHHDYFVCEMGAYQKGEIEKLCRLVGGTDISVITTVNAQHLERFGSLEKTAEAKWEIVEGLKPGGAAILNYDVAAVRERGEKLTGVDVTPFGIESNDVPLRATAVREQEGGIEVDVSYQDDEASVRVSVLGRHNAGNVVAAIGIGLRCGLDLPYMAAALRQFHSPEHRLQPLKLPDRRRAPGRRLQRQPPGHHRRDRGPRVLRAEAPHPDHAGADRDGSRQAALPRRDRLGGGEARRCRLPRRPKADRGHSRRHARVRLPRGEHPHDAQPGRGASNAGRDRWRRPRRCHPHSQRPPRPVRRVPGHLSTRYASYHEALCP